MTDLFGCIVEMIHDIQQCLFKKKKAKQRKFEKQNNLPKERMISPNQRVFILLISVVFISMVYITFLNPFLGEHRTTKKLIVLKERLEKEKEISGLYPKELKLMIRNNPTEMHLLKDSWGHNFEYIQNKEGRLYILFSSGKDGIANTEDDIR